VSGILLGSKTKYSAKNQRDDDDRAADRGEDECATEIGALQIEEKFVKEDNANQKGKQKGDKNKRDSDHEKPDTPIKFDFFLGFINVFTQFKEKSFSSFDFALK